MGLTQISISGISHNRQLDYQPDTTPEFNCNSI